MLEEHGCILVQVGGKSHTKMSMGATHRDGDKATPEEHFFVITAYRDNNRSYRFSLELKDLFCSSQNYYSICFILHLFMR